MALAVLHMDYIERAGVTLPGYDSADPARVSSSSHHSQVPGLKVDTVLDLVCGQIKLDAIVHLGIGVRVSYGATITGVQVGYPLGSCRNSLYPAQLISSLGRSNPVYSEPPPC